MRTESKQESLDGSLLTYMGSSASEADLREVCWLMIGPQLSNTELLLVRVQAFCRDIDAYSFEFSPPDVSPVVAVPGPGYRDEKPARCDVVPQTACAVAYDSGTCSGGRK